MVWALSIACSTRFSGLMRATPALEVVRRRRWVGLVFVAQLLLSKESALSSLSFRLPQQFPDFLGALSDLLLGGFWHAANPCGSARPRLTSAGTAKAVHRPSNQMRPGK
jgi:hypothetical protein